MTLPVPPDDVGRWFHALPEEARPVLLGLRALVHDLASQHDLGPVAEALKWGEPSFAVRSGTPVRLGWSEDRPDVCRVLVHCQTSVVSVVRDLYGATLTLEGTRAAVLDLHAPIPAGVRHMVLLALTYKRVRDLPALGTGTAPLTAAGSTARPTPRR